MNENNYLRLSHHIPILFYCYLCFCINSARATALVDSCCVVQAANRSSYLVSVFAIRFLFLLMLILMYCIVSWNVAWTLLVLISVMDRMRYIINTNTIHSCTHSLVERPLDSLIYLLVHLFIHSFARSFVCLSVRCGVSESPWSVKQCARSDASIRNQLRRHARY